MHPVQHYLPSAYQGARKDWKAKSVCVTLLSLYLHGILCGISVWQAHRSNRSMKGYGRMLVVHVSWNAMPAFCIQSKFWFAWKAWPLKGCQGPSRPAVARTSIPCIYCESHWLPHMLGLLEFSAQDIKNAMCGWGSKECRHIFHSQKASTKQVLKNSKKATAEY